MGKLLLPNEGLAQWNDAALHYDALLFGLLQTNLADDKDTTLADVAAEESTFPGYTRLNLATADWAPSVLVVDVAKAIANHLVWTFTGGAMDGEDIYGYFACDVLGTKLRLIQMFDPDPAVPIDLAHLTFTLVPGFGLFSQYTS